MGVGVGGGGGIPSDYLVSTQLQFWLFCFWGWGCCWAVTIISQGVKQVEVVHFFFIFISNALLNKY